MIAQTIKGLVNDETLKNGGIGHILAHAVAGAAMAAANGGDLLSGAISAGGAEALAPIIAEFLYGKGKTPEDLTADEKNILSAIVGILGTDAGALTGDSAIDAVIGDSVATNAGDKAKPYTDSKLLIQELISTKTPTLDPQGISALHFLFTTGK
ncbi:VENN motif pre-toxin domain-containing protein [Ignatzschineria sp. LJL83]